MIYILQEQTDHFKLSNCARTCVRLCVHACVFVIMHHRHNYTGRFTYKSTDKDASFIFCTKLTVQPPYNYHTKQKLTKQFERPVLVLV